MISKEDFKKIIDKYYPTMRYYQLVNLYFLIIDKNNPYYYKKSYCQKTFDKLKLNHHTYYSCCSFHQNIINLQEYMKIKLSKTRHEQKIYKKACEFFYKLNLQVLIKNKAESINKSKIECKEDDIKNWNFIQQNFQIKRSGNLFRFS